MPNPYRNEADLEHVRNLHKQGMFIFKRDAGTQIAEAVIIAADWAIEITMQAAFERGRQRGLAEARAAMLKAVPENGL